MHKENTKLIDKKIIRDALISSFRKLAPRSLAKNPVIAVTALGAVITTLEAIMTMSHYNAQISLWLWFTVLFANFSEALAEGRGMAQASSLKQSKKNLSAKIFDPKSRESKAVDATHLKKGDLVLCEVGDTIPLDGDVVEGVASVDESAITGESAPVIRESGGDRSAVTGGTTVKSDWIVVRITVERGESFVDRMIDLIEGAKRQKTPNEIALTLVLSGLSIILLIVVFSLRFHADYAIGEGGGAQVSITTLVALLVCLIPTTIGGLLSAIGISGMSRLVKRNVIAKSGRAVEAAGDISVLLMDKTGTITYGNRMATEFIPAENVRPLDLAVSTYLSSLSDETPEGRSIVSLATKAIGHEVSSSHPENMFFVPFTAETRMSGVDIDENGKVRHIRKGALDAVCKFCEAQSIEIPSRVRRATQEVAMSGGTPLVVVDGHKVMGVIHLKDVVKEGIRERFADLRKMGIRTVMITGDNPLTAASIAAEAGVDDFLAEATPEDKLSMIRREQEKGQLVAMTGDGTNDAPALAQSDVGVAMNTGTQAAREAGNMVDLDSDPTKLIDIVQVGKQLLITRGALTTFSFANDIAKYFAILPAIFAGFYVVQGHSVLNSLNIMGLASPQSAVLSAVIFNALIIIFLAPLAIRGVRFSPMSSQQLLFRNVTVYGLGGVILPFIGIKLIDLIVNAIGLA